jgi:hypothetical protein
MGLKEGELVRTLAGVGFEEEIAHAKVAKGGEGGVEGFECVNVKKLKMTEPF